MGDLLFSNEVTGTLGADITLHCLTLYTDPRGFNLRNEMAHGLLPPQQMTYSVATRLIHTLFVLGIWDQLAEARRSNAKQNPDLPEPASDTTGKET
jgi:hypothetical protein